MTDRIATAVIKRWIDADTVEVDEMDLGWGICIRSDPRRQTTHIRLAGVNAPDSATNAKWYDPELKQKGLAYCTGTWPPGTPVVLVSHELDDFGRSLADVSVAGVDVTVALLERGFVRTGDYKAAPREA